MPLGDPHEHCSRTPWLGRAATKCVWDVLCRAASAPLPVCLCIALSRGRCKAGRGGGQGTAAVPSARGRTGVQRRMAPQAAGRREPTREAKPSLAQCGPAVTPYKSKSKSNSIASSQSQSQSQSQRPSSKLVCSPQSKAEILQTPPVNSTSQRKIHPSTLTFPLCIFVTHRPPSSLSSPLSFRSTVLPPPSVAFSHQRRP